MLKDRYLQPELSDPVLEDSQVLHIVRSFVPGATKVTHVDETGGEARMYAVDEEIIFKVQRPHRLRLSTSLEREVFMLRYLEKNLPQLSVPRVLGYVKEGPMLEGTVMTRMPGMAVRYAQLSDEQREAMLREHGKALAMLHRIDQKEFLDCGLFPSDEGAEGLKDRYLSRFDAMLGRLGDTSDYEKDAARALVVAIVTNLPTTLSLVTLHSNPYKEHTFVKADKSYSGMIDFGDSYISHPANDLRRWNSAERKSLLRGYLGEAKMDDGFSAVWDIAYAIDALTNMLQRQTQVSAITGLDELLQWEWQ